MLRVGHRPRHPAAEGPGQQHQQQRAAEHREEQKMPRHPQKCDQKRHPSSGGMQSAQLLPQQDRERYGQRQHQRSLTPQAGQGNANQAAQGVAEHYVARLR